MTPRPGPKDTWFSAISFLSLFYSKTCFQWVESKNHGLLELLMFSAEAVTNRRLSLSGTPASDNQLRQDQGIRTFWFHSCRRVLSQDGKTCRARDRGWWPAPASDPIATIWTHSAGWSTFPQRSQRVSCMIPESQFCSHGAVSSWGLEPHFLEANPRSATS